jgi:hypothetical protein
MKLLREHIIFKGFWLFMALQILNLSVDPPDMHPDYVPEDLSYNDMESIVEIVLEQLLDIEDAIPEQDDDDSSRALLTKINFQSFYFPLQLGLSLMLSNGDINQLYKHIWYTDTYTEQFHPEVVPPPPKV